MMRAAAILLLLAVAASQARHVSLYERFDHWKQIHNKLDASPEEEGFRFQIWQQSLAMVKEHNAADHPYWLSMNKFADISWPEFIKTKLGASQNCSATHTSSKKEEERLGHRSPAPYQFQWQEDQVKVDRKEQEEEAEEEDEQEYGNVGRSPAAYQFQWQEEQNRQLPESIDWRDAGAVSKVKDQGNCGSCYSFSSTGAMESAYYLKYGEMKLFSEQQLVDCAQAFDNNGCNGGLPSHIFQYVRYNGGIETEEDYPYKAEDEKCAFTPSEVAATVRRSWNITFQDEDELTQAVGLRGPVSVAFQVAPDFRLYAGGVYDSHVCRDGPDSVNHAVLAVGYDTDEKAGPYWIIKNSWNTDWGIDGYFYMARGKNMCGVSDCASYPIMD